MTCHIPFFKLSREKITYKKEQSTMIFLNGGGNV